MNKRKTRSNKWQFCKTAHKQKKCISMQAKTWLQKGKIEPHLDYQELSGKKKDMEKSKIKKPTKKNPMQGKMDSKS